MIDHVSIGVLDVAQAKSFYDAALNPLGYSRLSTSDTSLGYGKDAVALWISTCVSPVPADLQSGLHFCFTAPTRKSVDAFHEAALVAATTEARAFAPTMGRTIMQHSSSIPPVTGSKPIVTGRRDEAAMAFCVANLRISICCRRRQPYVSAARVVGLSRFSASAKLRAAREMAAITR